MTRSCPKCNWEIELLAEEIEDHQVIICLSCGSEVKVFFVSADVLLVVSSERVQELEIDLSDPPVLILLSSEEV